MSGGKEREKIMSYVNKSLAPIADTHSKIQGVS